MTEDSTHMLVQLLTDHERLMKLFEDFCRAHSMLYRPEECFSYMSAFPEKFQQISFLET